MTYKDSDFDSKERELIEKINQASGDQLSELRAKLLKYYVYNGYDAYKIQDYKKAFEFLECGIRYAESFLEQEETLGTVREQVLKLYNGAGLAQVQAPFNDAAQSFELYQRGLTHAESFLEQGETLAAVREQVLKLYFDAGLTQGTAPFNDAAQSFELYQRGLRHAESFLEQGETLSSVRELVLKLYSNAVYTQRQAPFNDAAQAFGLYQRGLTHAENFLEQGETLSAVREHVLQLNYNAGVAQEQAPFNDVVQAFELWERGLTHAENFLQQGETLSAVRDLVLKLYYNAGNTQRQAPFNDAAQSLKLCQRGLTHAENFLQQGETLSAVRDSVLTLYDNISGTYGSSGQTGQEIQHLPILGLWSWVSLNQSEKRQQILHNWRIHLQISFNQSDFATITAAFRDLLYKLLLVWHKPQRPHRHFQFITTETLLAISESLYGIEQAEENQGLYSIYNKLESLQNSHTVQYAQDIFKQQQNLTLQLQQLWQKLNIQPNNLNDLTALEKLSYWQKIRHWSTNHKLRKNIEAYQQLPSQTDIAKNDSHWQRAVRRSKTALLEYLVDYIDKELQLPPIGLEELSDIILGILLANTSQLKNQEPEKIVENWLHNKAWQDTESLQTLLTDSDWQTWCEAPEPTLDIWLNLLNTQRLNVAEEITVFEQPELQTWLNELSEGKPNKLLSQLNLAWQNAKNKAEILARLLTALENYNFQGNFQKISFIKFSTYHQALAMVILGDAPQKIESALENWLEKQAKIDQTTSVLDTIHALKHRLNRAVSIYQPKHPDLGEAVHNWSKVLLEENLKDSENIETIWQILERSRIGLVGLTMKLPENWDIDLGKALRSALRKSIDELRSDKFPSENEPWPLLQIWLYQISEWMSYKTPTIDTCKQHLQAKQALVQPFFDGKQLQILWLDKTGLSLKQLPDNCAEQELWLETSNDSVINQWTRYFEDHKRGRRGISGNNPNWEKVMQTEPVQKLADTLKQWAAQLEQLTIIFPAPLGQLPWEILPQLENILVREISLGHWLKSPLTPLYERGELIKSPPLKKGGKGGFWVTSDPQGQAQCMVKEGQWVAKQFNTELENPCPSVFDALHHLANQKQAHICTHGKFDRNNPLASGLILQGKTDTQPAIKLPLWTCTQLPSTLDIIMLSACESNLNGQQTEGLLAPIGIGPSLAAAGVKTVVGTLWPCNGLATLCFNYYFYKIAQKNPQMPWHIVAAKARKSLKEMRRNDLKNIAYHFDLRNKNDGCYKLPAKPKPFNHFSYWACFSVLGNVQRQ